MKISRNWKTILHFYLLTSGILLSDARPLSKKTEQTFMVDPPLRPTSHTPKYETPTAQTPMGARLIMIKQDGPTWPATAAWLISGVLMCFILVSAYYRRAAKKQSKSKMLKPSSGHKDPWHSSFVIDMEETEQPVLESRPEPKNVPRPSSVAEAPQPSTSGGENKAAKLSVSKMQTFEVIPSASMEVVSLETQTAVLNEDQETQTPQPPKLHNARSQTRKIRTRSVGSQPNLLPPIRMPTISSSVQTDCIAEDNEEEAEKKETKSSSSQTESKAPKKPQVPSTSAQDLTVETSDASAQTGPMEVGDRPTESILDPVPYDANDEDTDAEEDSDLFVPEQVEFVPPAGCLDVTVTKIK